MLKIEVVAQLPGSMDHCSHCQLFIDGVGVGGQLHQSDLDSYPPAWREEWERLSTWLLRLAVRYPGQLRIHVIDAQSVQGLWRALRHGVRRYPTFIIGKQHYHGWDEQLLDELVSRELAGQLGRGPRTSKPL